MEFIEQIRKESREALMRVSDLAGLEDWHIRFLGRKGQLSKFLRTLKDLPAGSRRKVGEAANNLRNEFERVYREKKSAFGNIGEALRLDVSRPGKKFERGHLHPLTVVLEKAMDIFSGMGFAIVEGPEIETEYNNFDALNIPPWHPARDLMDTFWLKEPKAQSSKLKAQRLLLRTHTSPVQIRYMETHQLARPQLGEGGPPFRIIAPGTVYRHEATDARHEMQFSQIEGLMVGSDVSLVNLKWVVQSFLQQFFGPEVKLRMRPGYFPFVEPGAEFDLLCISCYGKKSKCKLCGGGGWLEFAGAGMVHPNVFRAVGYDPSHVQGFAFGMGVERLAMIKYKIDDIRLFRSGDLRFVKQF